MGLFEKTKFFIKNNDIQKVVTTISAQAMLSIANFLIALMLAKYAPKKEYGLFVFLFSFIGIFHGYHGALISAPLMVLVNQKKGSEKAGYIASLGIGRNFLLVPILLLFSASLIFYNAIILGQYQYIIPSVLVPLVIWMYISKEFFRTLNFTLLKTNTIFVMDLLMVLTVFGGIYLIILNKTVSAFWGLMVLGSGYTISYIYGKTKTPYKRVKNLFIKEALKENWSYGKWLLLGMFSSIFQSRSYIYIISGMIGLGALADVSASRLFLMPMVLLNGSVVKIMIAKGSLMVSKNENRKFRNFMIYFILVLVAIWFVYFVTILLFSDLLIGYLGEKYSNVHGLIFLWGIYVLIQTIKSMLGTSIIVYKRFKNQAKYDIFGAVTVIISCFFFVLLIGKSGAILSLIAGDFLVMLLYIKLFLKINRESLARTSDLDVRDLGVQLQRLPSTELEPMCKPD
ncbi:MAG TPA: hypothetical protein ENH49_01130 [Candidatus Marinimicrobia bacterium]|nr:hypothetical protein [Candidatus Neomarinimicrobiota bacterium]